MARTLLLEDRDLRITVETPVINVSRDIRWRALIRNLRVERAGFVTYGAYSRVDFRISFENIGLCNLDTKFVVSLLDKSKKELAKRELDVFVSRGSSYSETVSFTIPSYKAAQIAYFCIDISDPAIVRFGIPLG